MDIEEKLQELFRLQPLQNELIVLRQDCPELYRKYVKQACTQDIKNLVNVEINLVHTELKLPDPSKIPPLHDQTPGRTNLKLDDLMQDQAMTLQALEILDMI